MSWTNPLEESGPDPNRREVPSKAHCTVDILPRKL